MKFRFIATALLAVTLVICVGTAAPAADEPIAAVGWWSQRPGAAALPSESFEIALFPNGPVSQAALRIQLSEVPASALLELAEYSQVLGDAGRIQACPTNEPWTPANPGAWADAPAPNCNAGAAALGRNADGTWTGEITSLLRSGSTSIVIVPVSDVSDQQQSFTFQVVFAKARLIGPVAGAPTTSAPTATALPPSPSVPTTGTGLDFTPGPVPVAPSSPFPSATATPAETAVAAPPAATQGEAKPWWRLAFGVPLSVAAGFAAAFGRRLVEQSGRG